MIVCVVSAAPERKIRSISTTAAADEQCGSDDNETMGMRERSDLAIILPAVPVRFIAYCLQYYLLITIAGWSNNHHNQYTEVVSSVWVPPQIFILFLLVKIYI